MPKAEWFENYVNYAGSKTYFFYLIVIALFENYVNYAGSKTEYRLILNGTPFENYVNYAGSKTDTCGKRKLQGLRTM